MPETAAKDPTPRASRPYAPNYGIKGPNEGSGLLPWSWAEERLQNCRNFYLTTASPNARPHIMPVWGLWLEGKFLFSSGKQSRKSKNLTANPRCAVATGNADEAVIVEGTVSLIRDRDYRKRFEKAVEAKYNFNVEPYADEPVYVLTPEKAFGLVEKDFIGGATRWIWQ
jgi:hypothetical protein